MTNIRRGTIPTNFSDALKLDIGRDKIPTESSEKIVLTYDYSNVKVLDIAKSSSTITSGTNTIIYTTPTEEDFYLTNVALNFIKDAACDTASGSLGLSCSINGVAVVLLRASHHTLTAQNFSEAMTFNIPIKLDRGTNISIVTTPTFTAGFFDRSGFIAGYMVKG